MPSPTLRMRLYPKPESDENPRLKGEREPFPELRPGEMSSKYILSWAACSCPHMCICEKGRKGDSMLVEKTPETESPQKPRKCSVFPRAQTMTEAWLTAPTKAGETDSWTVLSQGPGYLWWLFADPGAPDSLVPTSRSEPSLEQMKSISSKHRWEKEASGFQQSYTHPPYPIHPLGDCTSCTRPQMSPQVSPASPNPFNVRCCPPST